MLANQNNRILNYLKQGKPLTPITALKMFDCFRLSARINDLRKIGWPIQTSMVKKTEIKRINGKETKLVKHYASYKLMK